MDFFRNRERCAICKKGKTKDTFCGDGACLPFPRAASSLRPCSASSGRFAVVISVLPLPSSSCGSRAGWGTLAQRHIHYITQQLWKGLKLTERQTAGEQNKLAALETQQQYITLGLLLGLRCWSLNEESSLGNVTCFATSCVFLLPVRAYGTLLVRSASYSISFLLHLGSGAPCTININPNTHCPMHGLKTHACPLMCTPSLFPHTHSPLTCEYRHSALLTAHVLKFPSYPPKLGPWSA